MVGAGPRRKGFAHERWVASKMRAIMPGEDIKRGLQSRGGGAEEADVIVPFFHIECKIGKLPNPRAALAQAIRDRKPGKMPVAVVRDDRQEAFIVMTFEDWLELVEEWWRLGADM